MPTPSKLSIPVPGASEVLLRYSPLPRAGTWDPDHWASVSLVRSTDDWWRIDLATLGLADGAYEYEFAVNRGGWFRAPDPYAEEITKFSGYRSVFRMLGGARYRLPFDWTGDAPLSGGWPGNNQLVIYELPMRWVDPGDNGYDRQVGLGTFEKTLFQYLDSKIADLGINCIELLPVQDSTDTLNWGYGTRFFFAPDLELGEPFDLKLFVKVCHQKGIRVIFDLVMNHARACPLENLAFDWFFLANGMEEPITTFENGQQKQVGRPDWGGKTFRYRAPRGGGFRARDFHYDVARFLIREFHADGFRLDEFQGIDNFDFIQDFTDKAHEAHASLLPGRPFLVIAEDSWRRGGVTNSNHRGRRVVDAIWDFDFRDTVRQIVSNTLSPRFGETSRSERVKRMVAVGVESLAGRASSDAFWDLSRRVTYCTSHDVAGADEQRLYSYFLMKRGLQPSADGDVDTLTAEQVVAAFALTLTAAGMPMFLAGEEFADKHDLPNNKDAKMSDPVDWGRITQTGRGGIRERVTALVNLRTTHPALHRNEVAFFGFGNSDFHPTFNGISSNTDGERLFAYCRTAGKPLGQTGQVIVIANTSEQDYPEIWIDWPWDFQPSLKEHGDRKQPYPFVQKGKARLALGPYQVRVFAV